MNKRSVAWVIAVPSVILLWLLTVFAPLPFVTYQPGLTENLLGKYNGQPVVQVSGHEVYRDTGEMHLTTIYVSGPESRVSLWNLMTAWFNEDDAIYPYEYQYPSTVSSAQDRAESQALMADSQEVAVANALREMGEKVDAVKVAEVAAKSPATGKFEVGDVIASVNGTAVTDPTKVTELVQKAGAGTPVTFQLIRSDKERTVTVTPALVEGKPRVGVSVAPGYRFPFKVALNMDEQIGGPSAGLMFSLAVYDTLTPGSLTDGAVIAGTGTAQPDGSVGPIGGIQQKIAAAHDAGAELFFVPKDDCSEALGSPHADELRLVRADTMSSAVDSLEAWTADRDAPLPTCS